jgi:hypothetical protein
LGQHRGHGAHREVELAVHPDVARLEGEPEQDLGLVGGDPARRPDGAGCSLLLRGRLSCRSCCQELCNRSRLDGNGVF